MTASWSYGYYSVKQFFRSFDYRHWEMSALSSCFIFIYHCPGVFYSPRSRHIFTALALILGFTSYCCKIQTRRWVAVSCAVEVLSRGELTQSTSFSLRYGLHSLEASTPHNRPSVFHMGMIVRFS